MNVVKVSVFHPFYENLHAGDPGLIPLNEEYRKATSSEPDDNGLP